MKHVRIGICLWLAFEMAISISQQSKQLDKVAAECKIAAMVWKELEGSRTLSRSPC